MTNVTIHVLEFQLDYYAHIALLSTKSTSPHWNIHSFYPQELVQPNIFSVLFEKNINSGFCNIHAYMYIYIGVLLSCNFLFLHSRQATFKNTPLPNKKTKTPPKIPAIYTLNKIMRQRSWSVHFNTNKCTGNNINYSIWRQLLRKTY